MFKTKTKKMHPITCNHCNTSFEQVEGLYKYFRCPFCSKLVFNPTYERKKAVADGKIPGYEWDWVHKQVRKCR